MPKLKGVKSHWVQTQKNGKNIMSYALHTHAVSSSVSYACFEYLFTILSTDGRNWSPVAETDDTNSIFKIL